MCAREQRAGVQPLCQQPSLSGHDILRQNPCFFPMHSGLLAEQCTLPLCRLAGVGVMPPWETLVLLLGALYSSMGCGGLSKAQLLPPVCRRGSGTVLAGGCGKGDVFTLATKQSDGHGMCPVTFCRSSIPSALPCSP